jgi:transcriptional regulator with XRE-family HTH domain
LLNICDRLKEERARLGLNQADFAQLAGVSKTSQFNYEKGDRSPDAHYLARLLEAGVDVMYIVSGTRTRPSGDLSEAEALLVERYRVVNKKDQQTVEHILGVMAGAL